MGSLNHNLFVYIIIIINCIVFIFIKHNIEKSTFFLQSSDH